MRLISEVAEPELSFLGLELGLTEQEKSLQLQLRDFCDAVVNPTAKLIDQLPASSVGEDALFWEMYSSFNRLGLNVDDLYLSTDKLKANRLKSIAYQELGRGDAGFAIGLMVANYPYVMCRLLGRHDLAEKAAGKMGCWIATQPSRGSDVGDIEGTEKPNESRHQPGEMYAEINDSEVILHGESSDWVSLAPVASVAIGYFPLREKQRPLFNKDGTTKGIGVFVPLDADGVSKGAALEKLGQRTLPQGSIKFNHVRLPIDHIIAGLNDYRASMLSALCEGNHTMAAVFTGCAQRAYELAMEYSHNRIQGGVPIVKHQAVHLRLFDIFRRIESMRAVTKQSFDYNALAKAPHLLSATVAKVHVTENAVIAISECMRLFGGKGLIKSCPMEKLLRDARASVTEDGDNHLLSLKAGTYLSWAHTGFAKPEF